MRAALAVARVQFRILAGDPWFLIVLFVMPLVVMPLFKGLVGGSLASSGYEGASGAEFVVPGGMVMFGFFVGGSVGFSVFREHGWKTWDRLRSSHASPWALLAGFALPWILLHIVYSAFLLSVGGLFTGLRLEGSVVAVGLMLVAYACCLIALFLLATATFRTVNQLVALQNVGAMLFAGLGGALVPFETLPGWAQAIGPITPAYWAMRGHRAIFLDHGGVGDVLLPATVLMVAAVGLAALGALRFQADESKEFFA